MNPNPLPENDPTINQDQLPAFLLEAESFRSFVYADNNLLPTIGIGVNLSGGSMDMEAVLRQIYILVPDPTNPNGPKVHRSLFSAAALQGVGQNEAITTFLNIVTNYLAGHKTELVAGAKATNLIDLLDNQLVSYFGSGISLSGVQNNFSSFSQAAAEAAVSFFCFKVRRAFPISSDNGWEEQIPIE